MTAEVRGADLRGSDLTGLDPRTVALVDALVDVGQAVALVTALGLRVGGLRRVSPGRGAAGYWPPSERPTPHDRSAPHAHRDP